MLTILPDYYLYRALCVNLLSWGVRACIERSLSGNIQVTEYSPRNNVSEHAQIYVDNIMAVLVTKRVEYTILFWPLKALYKYLFIIFHYFTFIYTKF